MTTFVVTHLQVGQSKYSTVFLKICTKIRNKIRRWKMFNCTPLILKKNLTFSFLANLICPIFNYFPFRYFFFQLSNYLSHKHCKIFLLSFDLLQPQASLHIPVRRFREKKIQISYLTFLFRLRRWVRHPKNCRAIQQPGRRQIF